MKRMLVTLALTSLALAGASAQSGYELLQQGLSTEQVKGDVKGAIAIYERVAREFIADRTLAARALLQAAKAYDKLRHPNARRIYERLVSEFAEQRDIAATARGQLQRGGSTSGGAARDAQPDSLDVGHPVVAMAPDGARAIVAHFPRSHTLGVYEFGTKQIRPLVEWRPGEAADFAVWAPDGRRVAFAQMTASPSTRSELRITRPDGRSRVLYSNDSNPGGRIVPAAWLPDASGILAVVERSDTTWTMGVIPTTGGQFTPLRSFSWAFNPVDAPAVSPDGRFVAFVDHAAGSAGDVHVIGVDGRTGTRLSDHPAADRQPLWSPDGGHLAFVSNRSGSNALWIVPMRDGRATGDPAKVQEALADVDLIAWTARGLAYVDRQPLLDIYLMDVDPRTGDAPGAAQQLSYPRTGRNTAPSWSPDGRHLAFISSTPADPTRRHVVIAPVAGGQTREYVAPELAYEYPQAPYDLRWSADATALAFSGSDPRGGYAMLRLELASGEWSTFPIPVRDQTRIELTSDNASFVYAQPAAGGVAAGIVERSTAGERERVVYRSVDGRFIQALKFDPQRKWLAFRETSRVRGDGVATSLRIVETGTGEVRTLWTHVTAPDSAEGRRGLLGAVVANTPGWSADGRDVRALLVRSRKPDLRRFPIDGGPSQPLPFSAPRVAGAHDDFPTVPSIDWSPDGQRVAFVWGRQDTTHRVLSLPVRSMSATAARGTRK